MKYFKIYLFFSNLIFLNIPILHANSTLSAFCSWIIFLAWIQPGDILSECQPLDALIQHVLFCFFKFFFYLFSAKKKIIYSHACCCCYLIILFVICLPNKLWPRCFFFPLLNLALEKTKNISSGLLCHMILHEHYIYYHPDSAHSLCCGLVVDVWWWLC